MTVSASLIVALICRGQGLDATAPGPDNKLVVDSEKSLSLLATAAQGGRRSKPPTNSLSPAPQRPRAVRPLGREGQGQLLSPGVYETAPYTCIVVVPGNQWDDKMILGKSWGIGSNAVIPRMPTIKPDLQFIPRVKH